MLLETNNLHLKTEKDPDTNLIFAYLQSKNLDWCLYQMHNQKIDCIILNSVFGWEENTPMDFLNRNSWIKGIRIINDFCDISPINNLKNLEYFGGSGKFKGELDFSNLQLLHFLAFKWDDKLYNNFNSLQKLKEIRITNLPYKDLTNFDHLFEKVKRLYLIDARKLQTLEGLEKLPFLSKLDIYNIPNLIDITPLNLISNTLQNLNIWNCKRITDYSVIEKLINLETFVIQKSAPIHSVQMLKELEKLWYVSINTEILDGNVEYLKEKNFKFKKMKKYNQ